MLLLGGAQISSHLGSSFPLLLGGGNKLGFRHGQHLKWQGNERSASDLYLTILQQLRCPVEAFKESKGPIRELLACPVWPQKHALRTTCRVWRTRLLMWEWTARFIGR